MSDKRKEYTGKDERDAMIGRFFARDISNAGVKGECPPLEDIATFIDNRFNEEQRSFITGHLSSCSVCYEVFSETAKTVHNEHSQSAIRMRKALYFAIPSAIAVAAMFFLIIRLSDKPVQHQQADVKQEKAADIDKDKERSFRPGDTYKKDIPEAVAKKYTPPSINGIVNVLSKDSDIKSLAGSIKFRTITSYGFAGSPSMERQAFIAGVYLLDLEAALNADDKRMSLMILKDMIPSFEPLGLPLAVINFYRNAGNEIEKGVPPIKFAGKSQAIEGELQKKNLLLYLRIGGWVEGGKLAAISQNRAYFDPETVRYFRKGLEGRGLPEWVLTSLSEIDKVSSDGVKDIKDFKRLHRLFEELQQGTFVSL